MSVNVSRGHASARHQRPGERAIAICWGQVAARGGAARRRLVAAPSEEVVVPVDPLHRDVLNVVEGTQGARQKWAAPADGFGFEQPDRRLGRALAYASPIHPIDAATSSSTRVSANAIEAGRVATINRLNNPIRL